MVFWVGEMPRTFDKDAVIERAVGYAVRVKGNVIALEQRNVGNVLGSAQRSHLDEPVVFTSDSFRVGPSCRASSTRCARHHYHRARWEGQAS